MLALFLKIPKIWRSKGLKIEYPHKPYIIKN